MNSQRDTDFIHENILIICDWHTNIVEFIGGLKLSSVSLKCDSINTELEFSHLLLALVLL